MQSLYINLLSIKLLPDWKRMDSFIIIIQRMCLSRQRQERSANSMLQGASNRIYGAIIVRKNMSLSGYENRVYREVVSVYTLLRKVSLS